MHVMGMTKTIFTDYPAEIVAETGVSVITASHFSFWPQTKAFSDRIKVAK